MKHIARTFWAVAAACALLLVAQPVDARSQFIIAAGCLVAMLLLGLFGRAGIIRQIYLALGSFIVLRYAYWRVTDTLPSIAQPEDFIPAVILLAAELYCMAMLAISLFVNAKPLDRPPARRLDAQDAPTVDVFVPSYNESPDIVAVTLAAARALDYPAGKLVVHLLDDGGTDEKVHADDPRLAAKAKARRETMQQICRDLGVVYHTRAQNLHAKAGNLNNGLAHSTGELIVVFDADHVPSRDFLQETVGYFADNKRLFLVQTPHTFINPDPLEKNLATYARMPSENEMFYASIQKGLDQWNATFFCGSAAVLRREALEETGGFAGLSITEDCETALELHARGWDSVYVDKPMISGLQPETFASFIGQRSRWCRGMLQIFLLKNPLLAPGLTGAQRLCYMSSNVFWLFPIPRFIFLLSPLLFIFFNLEIYNAGFREFVAYTMTYMIATIMMQNYLFGRVRWPWISEIYEYVQAPFLLGAIVSVIVDPKAPKFNVTNKGQTLAEDHLSEIAWPFYLIFALLAAAAGYSVNRYLNEPELRDLIVLVGTWNLLNLVLACIGLGVVSERRERRSTQRLATASKAELDFDGQRLAVSILDLSIGGLRLNATGATIARVAKRGQGVLTLKLGDGVETIPVQVRNARLTPDGLEIGARFGSLDASRFRAVAALAYAEIGGLVAARKRRQSARFVVAATLEMIAWGARHGLRGLYFGVFRRGVAAARPQPVLPVAVPLQEH
jgi:cellulose synthase (UDP-forming)